MKIGNSPLIYPASSYGQKGFQSSQEKLDNASTKVAEAATRDINNIAHEKQEQAADKNAAPHERRYGSPIQDGLIEAKTSELEAQANAKVIKAADGNIGTLIDIKA